MLIGTQVGPFLIERELGSGAMGTVYRAQFEKEPGKVIPVALKVVSLGLLGNEGAMARFDREAAILKQLKHPHIVRLLAVGKYRQTPFIAMEFIDGESLDRVLTRRGKLAWEEVVVYAKHLCEALQHAHDKGIIHRDLKPSNLMVTREGQLKLTDFGIAKDTDVTALTGMNSTIGTAAYMSPEQCRGDRTLGPKSDLYSLGVCLYELLTSKKPFTAESTIDMFTKHVSEIPRRPRLLEPELPIWLDNLVMHLLEKNKDARPLDAGTVGQMLADIETKVQSQQSIGVEVASARKVDRQIHTGRLSEEDKAAARQLRGLKPKKKKKKKPAIPWGPAIVYLGGLLAILGVLAYAVSGWFVTEPIEAQYAQVENAGDRAAAAEEFLKTHRGVEHPLVEKTRQLFIEEKAKEAERGLVKRFQSKFKANSENYDSQTYPIAIAALEEEAKGDLKLATEYWQDVYNRTPTENPAALPEEAEVLKVRLRWVAARRLADLRSAPKLLQKLADDHEKDRILELERPFDPSQIESWALKAHRLERVQDLPKAKRAWQRVAEEAEKRSDWHSWELIAREKVALAKDPVTPAEEQRKRQEQLTKLLREAETLAGTIQTSPTPAVVLREVRNRCRDLVTLYSDETEEPIPSVVKGAKQLLESLKATKS